jgi:hypothetical protein
MEGATAGTRQTAISDGGAAMTKDDDMVVLSERLLQLANDEATAQIHDVAIKIAALVSQQIRSASWMAESIGHTCSSSEWSCRPASRP